MEWQESVRGVRRSFPAGNNGFTALQKRFTVHEDHMAASEASDFDVRTGPDYFPCIIPAGMGLPCPDHIARQDIILHGAPPRIKHFIFHIIIRIPGIIKPDAMGSGLHQGKVLIKY